MAVTFFWCMKSEELIAEKYSKTGGMCSELVGTCFTMKNKILIKILVGKRSVIGIIVEYYGILIRFPNQALQHP